MISLNIVRAAAELSSKKDLRNYLNGVWLMPDRVIGMESGAAILIRHNARIDRAYFVPLEIVKELKSDITSITVAGQVTHLKAGNVTHTYPAEHDIGPIANGKYLAVLPNKPNGQAAQFDPDLLIRFTKAAKHLGVKNSFPILTPNGRGPALVALDGFPGAVGVIMPRRPAVGSDPLQSIPDRVKQ